MGVQSTHTKVIRTTLIDAMRTGPYAEADHLPPETELSAAMGISRTQLRKKL